MVYVVVGVFVAFILVAVVFGRRKGGDGNYSSGNDTWGAGGGHGGHHGCSGGGSCSGGSSCGGGCGGGGGD